MELLSLVYEQYVRHLYEAYDEVRRLYEIYNEVRSLYDA